MDKQNVVYSFNGMLISHKRNEILLHVTTWMNLDNVMLSERTQTQRPHAVWICLYEIGMKSKSIGTKSRLVVDRGLGGGVYMVTAIDVRVSFGGDKIVRRWWCNIVNVPQSYWPAYFKMVYEILRVGEYIKMESRLVVVRSWRERRNGGQLLNAFPFGDKNVLEMDSSDSCTRLWM